MSADALLHPAVGLYLLVVVLGQVGLAAWRWFRSYSRRSQRREQGLSDEVLLHTRTPPGRASTRRCDRGDHPVDDDTRDTLRSSAAIPGQPRSRLRPPQV